MSKKKNRKTAGKGFGKPSKPQSLISAHGLLLLTRSDLLKTLRWVKSKEELDSKDLASQLPIKTGSPIHDQKLLNLSSCGHIRHDDTAVPVSVFHDLETDTAYYSPLTREEFYLLKGARAVDENRNVVREVEALDVQYGITDGNTFYFSLGRLDELEEMLPYHEPTLDELIYLGRMDEFHTPLTEKEMQRTIGSIYSAYGQDWSKLTKHFQTKKDDDGLECVWVECVMGRNQEVYFQPQKTALAWSKCVESIPVWFEKNGMIKFQGYKKGGTPLTRALFC